MSKLCIDLPPFAPDYSGAASALYDMGGLIVIHDASGCTGNYTGFDEPRWYESNAMVFCSGLRHMDAVLGNDNKLIKRIEEAAKSLNPKFIAVLGSPVPMVIGTDFKGIAHEIEVITGIPSIGVDTTGLHYYGQGICDATLELMKKMIKTKKEKIPNTINIIGMTPLDFYTNSNDKDFIQLFEEQGIEVKACYYMGLTVDKMIDSVSASLNVVVSQAGIAVAEYMKTKYDIPYTVITPMGDGTLAVDQVVKALNGTTEDFVPATENAKVIIVGEQIISNSMRQYLQQKENHSSITVATLYDVSKKYQALGDIKVKNEAHLRKILNSGQYEILIADPMIKQLIKDSEVKFYDFPHVALSSKLHWDECKRLLSEDTIKWLKLI